MMCHSRCTYHHTKGRTPGQKRVLFKVEMHCQYYKKQLTSEQQKQNALARCKNARKALMHGVQSKNTVRMHFYIKAYCEGTKNEKSLQPSYI